jgi:hypothetical protein
MDVRPTSKSINWKRVLESSRVRRLLLVLAVFWGLMGILAEVEVTRAWLENFTTTRVEPTLAAIDPWFIVTRVWDYTGPIRHCDTTDMLIARSKGSRECDDPGLVLRAMKLPGALWRAAGDVKTRGWPAVVSAVLSLVLGVSAVLDSKQWRDPSLPWWHPLNLVLATFVILVLAGVSAWLLKEVFLKLSSAFGWIVALTGVYSTQIIYLNVAYHAVKTWLEASAIARA